MEYLPLVVVRLLIPGSFDFVVNVPECLVARSDTHRVLHLHVYMEHSDTIYMEHSLHVYMEHSDTICSTY